MIERGSGSPGTSGRHRRSLGLKYLLMSPVDYLGAPRYDVDADMLNVLYWPLADIA